MNPFSLLLLVFVPAFFAWRLLRRVQRLKAERARAAEQMLEEETRYSRAAGNLSDCPRPVDRDGRQTYAGWILHPEAAAERKTRPHPFEEEQLHQRLESLLKQAISDSRSEKEADGP